MVEVIQQRRRNWQHTIVNALAVAARKPRGAFAPGHDQKLRAALEKACRGLLQLRALVERAHGVDAVQRELTKAR
jgi:hypothetical protein